MQCTICLSDEGEVVQKGCFCRGDAGAAHVECLIELAKHNRENNGDWLGWQECGTCKARFTGPVQRALAKAWFACVESLHLPPGTEEHTGALLNLACDLNENGEYTEAESLLAQVHATRLEVLGPTHIDTHVASVYLAKTYRYQGNYTQALALHIEADAAIRVMEGVDDQTKLFSRSELGLSYQYAGQLEPAHAIQRELFEARKAAVGLDNAETQEMMEQLANTSRELGKTEEAVDLFTDLIARRKRVLGELHPHTLNSMSSLAILHMAQEEYTSARELAQEVLALEEQVYGATHPNTIIGVHNLGLYTALAGRPSEAEPTLRRAIAAQIQLGFDQQTLCFFRASLGLTLSMLGRHSEAVTELRDAYCTQVETDSLGPEHPSTLRTASILGAALVAAGAVEEGRGLLTRTLAIQTRVLTAKTYDARQTAKRLEQCPPTEPAGGAARRLDHGGSPRHNPAFARPLGGGARTEAWGERECGVGEVGTVAEEHRAPDAAQGPVKVVASAGAVHGSASSTPRDDPAPKSRACCAIL